MKGAGDVNISCRWTLNFTQVWEVNNIPEQMTMHFHDSETKTSISDTEESTERNFECLAANSCVEWKRTYKAMFLIECYSTMDTIQSHTTCFTLSLIKAAVVPHSYPRQLFYLLLTADNWFITLTACLEKWREFLYVSVYACITQDMYYLQWYNTNFTILFHH